MNKDIWYLKYLFVMVLAGALIAALSNFATIDLAKLESADILNLLLTALFVSLVIERAVEVYANTRFDPKRSRIRIPIHSIEEKIKFLQQQLTEEVSRSGTSSEGAKKLEGLIEGARDTLLEVWRGEQNPDGTYPYKIASDLAELKQQKAAFAATVATILGLSAALVGVRIIGQFLPTDAEGVIIGVLAPVTTTDATGKTLVEYALQLKALRFVDVVLTTALLAGGADGIHRVIKRITDIRGAG